MQIQHIKNIDELLKFAYESESSAIDIIDLIITNVQGLANVFETEKNTLKNKLLGFDQLWDPSIIINILIPTLENIKSSIQNLGSGTALPENVNPLIERFNAGIEEVSNLYIRNVEEDKIPHLNSAMSDITSSFFDYFVPALNNDFNASINTGSQYLDNNTINQNVPSSATSKPEEPNKEDEINKEFENFKNRLFTTIKSKSEEIFKNFERYDLIRDEVTVKYNLKKIMIKMIQESLSYNTADLSDKVIEKVRSNYEAWSTEFGDKLYNDYVHGPLY